MIILSKKAKLSIIFYPQEGGGYTVRCPELQGCISEGDTMEEAYKNILEAIELCLEDEGMNKDMFLKGLAVDGKMYREVEIEI